MNHFLENIEFNFEQQINNVNELMNFDQVILDFCIQNIEILNERLKKGVLKIDNPYYLADTTLKMLKNIRNNESLQNHYRMMLNQGLVLLVSHFSSCISEIFKSTLKFALDNNKINNPDDIKVSLSDLLSTNLDVKAMLIEQILKKKDISFQDMQSISRAFKIYTGIEIEKNMITNDIIIAHASRHCIVHNLGIPEEKFYNQIANAIPNGLNRNWRENNTLQFTKNEISYFKEVMLLYVKELIKKIYIKFECKS